MSTAIVPQPRCSISVRVATLDDLSFIDSLQRMHTHQVGWMPTQQLEGKIKLGHCIIAEDEAKQAIGYSIGNDQYFKRDDVGIIYQMNVVPAKQRGLIGATLVKAMFDRAAYGCKLFCCWCAQDIEANHFWESLGFIPLAFRAGSRGKDRVHIFWQRRIRAGDTTTPYWFPSQTTSGSIREDRLVFPIPPGVNWRDEMPRVFPTEAAPKLEAPKDKRIQNRKSTMAKKPPIPLMGRLQFVVPVEPKAKPKREPKAKVKNDPKLVAAARELRDRWLERVNSDPSALLSGGKYDIGRITLPDSAAAPSPMMLEAKAA